MLEADLSYEIDVWGRIRNSVASARATEQATVADLATLDLSTHAELATDYFTLCGQDTQVALLDQTVADYEHAVALTRSLFEGGRRGSWRPRSGRGPTRNRAHAGS